MGSWEARLSFQDFLVLLDRLRILEVFGIGFGSQGMKQNGIRIDRRDPVVSFDRQRSVELR